MKLVFNHAEGSMTLAFVECTSTDEADNFLKWYESRAYGQDITPSVTHDSAKDVTPEVLPDTAPVVEHKVPTGGVPKPTKVTRAELSAAAMELMNAKGRSSLQAVLDYFQAKRVSDIPEANMAEAFNRMKESV